MTFVIQVNILSEDKKFVCNSRNKLMIKSKNLELITRQFELLKDRTRFFYFRQNDIICSSDYSVYK